MKKIYLVLLLLVATLSQSASAQYKIANANPVDSCGNLNANQYQMMIWVDINQTGSGLSLKTYFGDGTSANNTIGNQSTTVWVNHTYSSAGNYTIKHVLFHNGNPVDSTSYSYQIYCSFVTLGAYDDNNSNCSKNTGESFIPMALNVEVDSAGTIIDTITIFGHGWYQVKGAATYKFKLLNPPTGTGTLCPASGVITVNVTGPFTSQTAFFGIQCGSSSQFDLAAAVNGRFRPVSNSFIDVYASNISCNAQNATLTLQIDANYTYGSANITPSNVSGNTITWSFNNLSISQGKHIQVLVTPTTTVKWGDTICNTVNITPSTGDANTANNTQTTCNTVRAAFDPNDKSVTPERYIIPGETLTYNINFENLGDDTAFNIYILDTLSENLDVNSIQVLNASHAFQFSIQNGPGAKKVARFDFADIQLPDKSSPDYNKGSVSFSIKTKTSLMPSTQIPNRAGIYFDVSPVVLTNTAISTIKPVGVEKIDRNNNVRVYPNPVNDRLVISTEKEIFNEIKIINNLGQVLKAQAINGTQTTISTKDLPVGLYTVMIYGDEGIVVRKIEKL